jgi:hypothetical protein
MSPTGSPAFPNLRADNHHVTSKADPCYNCIAWAANQQSKWWWPSPHSKDAYWPPGFRRGTKVRNFEAVFRTQGYKRCNDSSLVDGYEKICLYTDRSGNVTHMARQLTDGLWTSKLGEEVDISHYTPQVLDGGEYGTASVYLERPRGNS